MRCFSALHDDLRASADAWSGGLWLRSALLLHPKDGPLGRGRRVVGAGRKVHALRGVGAAGGRDGRRDQGRVTTPGAGAAPRRSRPGR